MLLSTLSKWDLQQPEQCVENPPVWPPGHAGAKPGAVNPAFALVCRERLTSAWDCPLDCYLEQPRIPFWPRFTHSSLHKVLVMKRFFSPLVYSGQNGTEHHSNAHQAG